MGWLRRKLFQTEQFLVVEDEPEGELVKAFGTTTKRRSSMLASSMTHVKSCRRNDQKIELLEQLESSAHAFVVFKTEQDRDKAVLKVATCGLQWNNQSLELKEMTVEPDTVQWPNFGHSSLAGKVSRLFMGFGYILLGVLLWTTVFYSPYAWSVMHFNYDNGQEPGLVYGIAFSMVVVIGNNMMYEICARVSDYIGFLFKDEREACYMVLYCIACIFNVLLDFVTTYFMALQVMGGLGFRLYDGTRLENVSTFKDQFESYAMQRSLAENTFLYAFPSTFLIPFLIEPIITIWVPLKLGQLIVRTHPEIMGPAAEGWLVSAPMEMGRYADILLDVLLGLLIFYFPGGYTHTLFFAMAGSHVFIYAFDHYRVLRTIPSCIFASFDVEWCAQAMLAPCCGLILSVLVFKSNCEGHGYCLQDKPLVAACTGAFILHTIVHWLLLIYVVPRFGIQAKDALNTDIYKEVNEKLACSWFSANPVHCLRSRYIYNHNPPCGYFVSGKEHLLTANPAIGCFFNDECVEAEDFDDLEIMTSIRSTLGSGRDLLSKMGQSVKNVHNSAKTALSARSKATVSSRSNASSDDVNVSKTPEEAAEAEVPHYNIQTPRDAQSVDENATMFRIDTGNNLQASLPTIPDLQESAPAAASADDRIAEAKGNDGY